MTRGSIAHAYLKHFHRAPAVGAVASSLRSVGGMLKLIGSAVIARLLGFGLIGFIVIYLLFTLLS
jgi:hypothetical protein